MVAMAENRGGRYCYRMRVIIGCVVFISAYLAGPVFAESVFVTDTVTSPAGHGNPHGSSLAELENGDLLATWYSTEDETSENSWIFGSIWSRETGKWSKPAIVVNKGYSKSIGNTALFRDDDGIIWMFFAVVKIGGWSGAVVDYVQSRDNGKTWSKGRRLVGWPGNMPRNLPISVGDHRMLVPLFVDFWYEARLTGSYTALLEYKDGRIINKSYGKVENHHAIQPTLAKLGGGRILMLMRDKNEKFVWRSRSTDNGKTWEEAVSTDLPNPDAAVSAVYVDELKAVLLVYNHSLSGRDPLSLAVSMDEGVTFKRIADIARKAGEEKSAFSYPTVLRTSDGMIHILWSHNKRETLKHAYFNLDWLKDKVENPAERMAEGSK